MLFRSLDFVIGFSSQNFNDFIKDGRPDKDAIIHVTAARLAKVPALTVVSKPLQQFGVEQQPLISLQGGFTPLTSKPLINQLIIESIITKHEDDLRELTLELILNPESVHALSVLFGEGNLALLRVQKINARTALLFIRGRVKPLVVKADPGKTLKATLTNLRKRSQSPSEGSARALRTIAQIGRLQTQIAVSHVLKTDVPLSYVFSLNALSGIQDQAQFQSQILDLITDYLHVLSLGEAFKRDSLVLTAAARLSPSQRQFLEGIVRQTNENLKINQLTRASLIRLVEEEQAPKSIRGLFILITPTDDLIELPELPDERTLMAPMHLGLRDDAVPAYFEVMSGYGSVGHSVSRAFSGKVLRKQDIILTDIQDSILSYLSQRAEQPFEDRAVLIAVVTLQGISFIAFRRASLLPRVTQVRLDAKLAAARLAAREVNIKA